MAETLEGAERFSSRKFIVTGTIGIAAIIALFTGALEGGHFATIASVCVGAYNLGNALATRKP